MSENGALGPRKAIRTLKGHTGSIHVAVYNVNGKYILTGGQDRGIKLWNAQTGDCIKTYGAHGWEVLGIKVAHDNAKFVSCGGDKTVFYWDVASGQTIRRLSGHFGRVNAVDFNFDSNLIASGSQDALVRLWDVRSGNRTPIQTLEQARDGITSLEFGANALLASASVDGVVRIYDIRQGLMHQDTIDASLTSVSFLKSGDCLLVSSLDDTIRLLDCNSGSVIQSYKGHQNSNYRLKSCFGSDDETVISGDENGQIFTWHVAEGTKLSQFPAHDRVIVWVSRHPNNDGGFLTASSDGYVKIWE